MGSVSLGELVIVGLICMLWIVPVIAVIAVVTLRGRKAREKP